MIGMSKPNTSISSQIAFGHNVFSTALRSKPGHYVFSSTLKLSSRALELLLFQDDNSSKAHSTYASHFLHFTNYPDLTIILHCIYFKLYSVLYSPPESDELFWEPFAQG